MRMNRKLFIYNTNSLWTVTSLLLPPTITDLSNHWLQGYLFDKSSSLWQSRIWLHYNTKNWSRKSRKHAVQCATTSRFFFCGWRPRRATRQYRDPRVPCFRFLFPQHSTLGIVVPCSCSLRSLGNAQRCKKQKKELLVCWIVNISTERQANKTLLILLFQITSSTLSDGK